MSRLHAALLVLFFMLSAHVSPSIEVDTLTPARPLTDGQELISAGGRFVFGFFSPIESNNHYIGIWYKVSPSIVVWVANRRHPISERNGSLSITANGTLIITDQNSKTIWSSSSSGLANPVAQLLDDGNFIVKEANGDGNVPKSFAWQSFDYPTDTLLPGMKLGWNLTSGFNRNLTSWTSPNDPTPGSYSMVLDVHGDPQIIVWKGSTRQGRVGPWNGQRFSGMPDVSPDFIVDFVMTNDEVFYMNNTTNTSIIGRLLLYYTGVVVRRVWDDDTQMWSTFTLEPKDTCDIWSQCGPYGLCNYADSPICSCLQGFKLRSSRNSDFRDGCERMTELDCRNGTDGFVTIKEVKLPDTSRSMVDRSMGLHECRASCLRNCSCTAYASADINGTGCIIWTTELTDISVYSSGGPDLYVRLAAADLGPGSDDSHSRTMVGIVVSSVLGTLLVVSVGICICIKRRRRAGAIPFASRRNKEKHKESKDWELPLFDLGTIIAATNNFSIENKLGQGGFGPVYKGKLGEEQEIAVKRLSKTSTQGTDEFMNEVTLIAKLQHRNLVRLLGCCTQGEERMLVYEYMPNSSLDAFLFDKDKGVLLDWQTRYNIIEGIAQGLLYLHRDSRLRIIHRDLKASNVLLDKDMNPKISDFGLARIFRGDETALNTRRVVGTYGYMSPEYAMDGVFSVKSDVFSFGVLVLEIISGKKNRGVSVSEYEGNLLAHAWNLWMEDKALELVDKSISNSIPMAEAVNCIKVGLLCVQESPKDRPTMSSVVLMLGSRNASLPNPKHPGFFQIRARFENESSNGKTGSASINEVSISTVEGR